MFNLQLLIKSRGFQLFKMDLRCVLLPAPMGAGMCVCGGGPLGLAKALDQLLVLFRAALEDRPHHGRRELDQDRPGRRNTRVFQIRVFLAGPNFAYSSSC